MSPYHQTATAAGAGKIAACSGATPIGTQAQTSTATIGGTSGGAVTVGGTQFDIGTNLAAVYMEIDPAAGDQWKAGNYVVRLNVTTLNANITWTGTYICRLNSSNVSQATIGSLTGQTTSLGSTGVKTHTVSGAAQTPAAGDKIYIVCVFSVVTSNNQSFGWTPNQDIDTPLVVAKTAAITDATLQNWADSRAVFQKGFRQIALSDAWNTLGDAILATNLKATIDLFNRADGDLGTNWKWDTAAGTIVSQAASSTSPSVGCTEIYIGNDTVDQWAETTIKVLGHTLGETSLQGPAVRMDGTTGFYMSQALGTDAGVVKSQIVKFPSNTVLASETVTNWQAGDTNRLVAIGTGANNLNLYRQGIGTPLLTASDATLTTGELGFVIYVTASEVITNSTIETWKGSVVGAGPTPLTFSGTDAMTMADSIAGFMPKRAKLSDDWAAWRKAA
jgi:hypothetical protein